jgi:Myb-like DNA-binding protein FlbD
MGRSTRRGPWLPDEDGTLLQLVHIQGPNNWVRISQHMQHRSPKQCRERYHQNLKPSLNHEPISPDEGEVIEQLVQDMGKRWAEIARRLGNRSDNGVKNWWNGSMNRRKRHNLPNSVSSGGVGPRSQPLHASSPSRPRPDFGPRFNFDDGQRLPLPAGVRFEQLPVLPYIDTEVHQHRDRLPQPFLPPLAPLPDMTYEPHSAPASLLNTPNPFPLRSLHPQPQHPGLRPPALESRHSYPSDWRLARMPGVEPSAISPAVTEFSHLPSIDPAPSLVSDNQSHCSISPKTVTSPRPTLPAPLDTSNTQNYNPEQRRNSYGPYGTDRNYHLSDEGYVSAQPPSTSTESSNTRFFLDPLLGRQVNQHEAKSRYAVQTERSVASSPTERDSRMNVSRLLD